MDNYSLVSSDKVYTVSEITQLIRIELEASFPSVWIEGEVSNSHLHSSGHLYFTLKDEQSQLKAVVFRSNVQKIPFQLKDGLRIICRGKITIYPPKSEYQIVVEEIEPKGKGAFQLAFEQLKEKLEKEGLFDNKYKKSLPLLPRKIGIVTSAEGAAIMDILRILERRFARLQILIYPAKVQGEGAPEEIVEGIEYFNKLPDIDVIIVGRGGGSIEDLWAFNTEKVARAIFKSRIPIISAVGHEIDFTISDFVADVRASTPSSAAEIVIGKEESFRERIFSLHQRMINALKYIFQQKKNLALSLIGCDILINFPSLLRTISQRIDELEIRAWKIIKGLQNRVLEKRGEFSLIYHRLKGGITEILNKKEIYWRNLSVQLNNLSPLSILKRGYSLCWKDEEKVLIREACEVNLEDKLRVSFYKGEIKCEVKEIDPDKVIPELKEINKGEGKKL